MKSTIVNTLHDDPRHIHSLAHCPLSEYGITMGSVAADIGIPSAMQMLLALIT